jgi:hypothetical protein
MRKSSKSKFLRILMTIIWGAVCAVQFNNGNTETAFVYGIVTVIFLLSLFFKSKSKT